MATRVSLHKLFHDTAIRMIALVASGVKRSALESELKLSKAGVDFHLRQIYKSLRIDNNIDLTHYAIFHRIVPLKKIREVLVLKDGTRKNRCGWWKCRQEFDSSGGKKYCCAQHLQYASADRCRTKDQKFIERICKYPPCGETFRTTRRDRLYCKSECYRSHSTQMITERRRDRRPIYTRICANFTCCNEFTTTRGDKYFCTRECTIEHLYLQRQLGPRGGS
jgi:hypothetical protein